MCYFQHGIINIYIYIILKITAINNNLIYLFIVTIDKTAYTVTGIFGPDSGIFLRDP